MPTVTVADRATAERRRGDVARRTRPVTRRGSASARTAPTRWSASAREIAFEGVTNPHIFYVIDADRRRPGWSRTRSTCGPASDGLPARLPDERAAATGGSSAWSATTTATARWPSEDARARMRRDFAVTYGDVPLVRHLPGAPPGGGGVPRRPVLPGRRRGARPLAGRRPGHEHRPAGRPQPGLQAGRRGARPGRRRLAGPLRGGTPARSRRPWSRRPTGCSASSPREGVPSRAAPARRCRCWRRSGCGCCPRSAGGSRLFQYVSQIRIRYPMLPGRAAADPVVGRRLPWAGGNFDGAAIAGVADPRVRRSRPR